MAYTNANQAVYRITSVLHGSSTLVDVKSCTVEKVINFDILRADKDNTPVSRPINMIDARVLVNFLDTNSPIAHTVSAANVVANFTGGDGTVGSITIGTMKAGSVTHSLNPYDAKEISQEFVFQGTSLTYTPTI